MEIKGGFKLELSFDPDDPQICIPENIVISFTFSTTIDPYVTYPEPTTCPPGKGDGGGHSPKGSSDVPHKAEGPYPAQGAEGPGLDLEF